MKSRLDSFLLGLLALFVGSWAAAIPIQQGMSYTPWGNDLSDPGTLAAFQISADRMSSDDVNWVALNVFEFQATPTSTVILPDFGSYSTSLATVEKAIEEFHSRGIKVLLKPNVDVVSGGWRGDIPGSAAWFDDPLGYKAFIGGWAMWAALNGVDAFCVGTEFESASWNTAKWQEVVALVRASFPGPLTYAANWTEFPSVGWWSALDYVGIDAYFPLTGTPNPTQAQLGAAWAAIADGIESWLTATCPDKDVLFTEIGYRSLNGANMAPYAWSPYDTTNVDLPEQAACYSAALTETWYRPWMAGYYWWNWETSPDAGIDPATGLPMNDYTPQNKPAELVLREVYTPEPTTLLLLASGALALARRRRRRAA